MAPFENDKEVPTKVSFFQRFFYNTENIYPGTAHPYGIKAASLYNTAENCKLVVKVNKVLERLESVKIANEPGISNAIIEFSKECVERRNKANEIICYISSVYRKSVCDNMLNQVYQVPRVSRSIDLEDIDLQSERHMLMSIVWDVRLSVSNGKGKFLLDMLSRVLTEKGTEAAKMVESLPVFFEEEIDVFIADSEYLSESFEVAGAYNEKANFVNTVESGRLAFTFVFFVSNLLMGVEPRYEIEIYCLISGVLFILTLFLPSSFLEGTNVLFRRKKESHMKHFCAAYQYVLHDKLINRKRR